MDRKRDQEEMMAVKRKPLNDDFAAIAASSDSAMPLQPEAVKVPLPETGKASKRDDAKARAHVSVYVAPGVHKAVKRIAIDHDLRPHDVYVEGLRMALEKYGYDFDKEARRR